MFDRPEIVALEKKNQRISAALTASIVIIFLLISFIWSGIRMIVPPPGDEPYELVGAFDYGDNRTGSKDINNFEPAIEDPAPEPVEEVAAPKPQQEVAETRSDPTPVVTQNEPSPVVTPEVKPVKEEKPKEKESVTETKPKVDPKKNNNETATQDTKPTETKPTETTKPSGSNQGDTNDPGNAGQTTNKEFDDRYSFNWGAGGGGGARKPLIYPDPVYNTQEEGIITLTITISPGGTVTKVVPAPTTKMTLRRNAMNAIRNWKFSPLPSNVPQEDQVVTMDITFILKG
jgi:protein TonB